MYAYLLKKKKTAVITQLNYDFCVFKVSDLEKVLKMLEEQSESDHDSWETRYCLLLWLSIIVIIPFDMRKLDGTIHVESKTTLQRLVEK